MTAQISLLDLILQQINHLDALDSISESVQLQPRVIRGQLDT